MPCWRRHSEAPKRQLHSGEAVLTRKSHRVRLGGAILAPAKANTGLAKSLFEVPTMQLMTRRSTIHFRPGL